MALSFYRGVNFIKDDFVKYLTFIFAAEEKGQLKFFDGTRDADFSNTPYVIKKQSWDFRNLPAVLVGSANGRFETLSISKDFIDEAQAGEYPQYREVGGDIDISISLDVYATTIEERDKLVDITGIYLSHPDCKDWFGRQGIRLKSMPTISEGGPVSQPAIDHPIYMSTLTMEVVGLWRDKSSPDERLINIITDIEAFMEFES